MKEGPSFAAFAVVVPAVAAALLVGLSSLGQPPALTGRLHPGVVPGALAGAVIVAAILSFGRTRPPATDDHRTGVRQLACAGAAILILAVATRPFGVALASLAAGGIAALGVAGTTPGRALRVAVGLSAGLSLMLSLVRQPLPLLPPGLVR